MKYEKEIYGKNGILRISGNAQEAMLFLKNEPIHYSWFAEIGSTWRYHIAKGINEGDIKRNTEIDRIVNKGISNEGEFLAVCEYYANFLNYGNYEFGYYQLSNGIYMTTIPDAENYVSYDYYGGCEEFTPTQRNISSELVETYKTQIQKGSKPSMILLHVENSHMFFILDGHHKFVGYGQAKQKPHALIITKKENEFKSIDYTTKLAKQMNCDKRNYFERMKSEKMAIERYKSQKVNLEEFWELIKYG